MAKCSRCLSRDADVQRWSGSEKANMTISVCSACFGRYFDERLDNEGSLTIAMRRKIQPENPFHQPTTMDILWPELEQCIPDEQYSGPWSIGSPPWRIQGEQTG